MIDCLRSRVRKQPIFALYFEFETVLKFYNLEARFGHRLKGLVAVHKTTFKVIIQTFFHMHLFKK